MSHIEQSPFLSFLPGRSVPSQGQCTRQGRWSSNSPSHFIVDESERSMSIVSDLQWRQTRKAFIWFKLLMKMVPAPFLSSSNVPLDSDFPDIATWYRFSFKCFLCNHLWPDAVKTLWSKQCIFFIGRLKRYCPHKQCYPRPKLPILRIWRKLITPVKGGRRTWMPAAFNTAPRWIPAESMRTPFTRGDVADHLCGCSNIYPLLFSNSMLCPTAWFQVPCLSLLVSCMYLCLYCLQFLYCLPYDRFTL